VPSHICQEAICIGVTDAMQGFLLQVATLAMAQPQETNYVSIVAYNLLLAALCDPILEDHVRISDKAFWAPPIRKEALQQAWQWLDHNSTAIHLGIPPDSVSYATVLKASAEMGNRTMADHIWDMVLQQLWQPTQRNLPMIHLVNARPKSLRQDDLAMLRLYQDIMRLYQDIIENNSTTTTYPYPIKPDKYTVDYLLLPMLHAGRIGGMEKMLDQVLFHSNQAASIVADAFQAFLWTLVDKGKDVAAAKAIFDMYMAPALEEPVQILSAKTKHLRLVTPQTRHITLLLEGYKQRIQSGLATNHDDSQNQDHAMHSSTLVGFEK
jgi:hypothetical protein